MADGSPGRTSTGYRRRYPLPALLVLFVLGMAVIVTWAVVLSQTVATSDGSCNPPTANGSEISPAPLPGKVQPSTALDAQAPVPAAAVRVHVLNASGQRDLAKLAASELAELGFNEAGNPVNDPLYPDSTLACFGQVRYGAVGAAAARTLSIVVPCAELVRDERPDDVVDLALGKDFHDIDPVKATRDALDAIARAAAADQHSGQPEPATAGDIDPAQLTALRESASCTG